MTTKFYRMVDEYLHNDTRIQKLEEQIEKLKDRQEVLEFALRDGRDESTVVESGKRRPMKIREFFQEIVASFAKSLSDPLIFFIHMLTIGCALTAVIIVIIEVVSGLMK